MAFSRFSLCTAAVVLGCAAGLAQAQAYVNGSISGQLAPGVYGRVDIGNAPPPALLYAQPMVAMPPAVVMPSPQPVYMWVPPGHADFQGLHLKPSPPVGYTRAGFAYFPIAWGLDLRIRRGR